jgi:hypothetical protein
MRVLGIETTCDETAASVVRMSGRGGGDVLSNEIMSQIAEHAAYGDEQGSPVDGQFPKEAPRPSSTPQGVDYNYRPDESSGDNTFTRFGPDLDEKKKVFAY